MKPGMYIIFNREMSDKLPIGIRCAFTGHAAMWLDQYLSPSIDNAVCVSARNAYGDFDGFGLVDKYKFSEWKASDYRKLVMTSPDLIENLFEKFKKAGIPCYMQKTSHDIKTSYCSRCGEISCCCSDDYAKTYVQVYQSETPICLAVFLWLDSHKELIKDMELM